MYSWTLENLYGFEALPKQILASQETGTPSPKKKEGGTMP